MSLDTPRDTCTYPFMCSVCVKWSVPRDFSRDAGRAVSVSRSRVMRGDVAMCGRLLSTRFSL